MSEPPPARPRCVGLYGGSFNPPHMAHVLVAAWALAGGELDELWIIPTGGHPFGKILAPFDDRLEMCRLAFAAFGDRLQVLDLEREARVHYSIDTLNSLIHKHPGFIWRWVMGSDTVADAPKWRRYADVMKLAPPLIIPRAGHPAGGAAGVGAAPHFALPDLSSTWVRGRLGANDGAALEGLVSGAVLAYLAQRRLYRDETLSPASGHPAEA